MGGKCLKILIVGNWKMAAPPYERRESPLISTFEINSNPPIAERACSPLGNKK